MIFFVVHPKHLGFLRDGASLSLSGYMMLCTDAYSLYFVRDGSSTCLRVF